MFEESIPMVLAIIISVTEKGLGDTVPSILEDTLAQKQYPVLQWCPFTFYGIRI